jgi:Tfp pilus assembly protein PilF
LIKRVSLEILRYIRVMRLRFVIALFLFAPPAIAECPPLPDRSLARAELLQTLGTAKTFNAGRLAVSDMWTFWRTAPDQAAQEMLDGGIEAIRYGDLTRAQSVLARLVAYCPAYSEGYNQLAFAYFLQEQDDEAERLLMKTLELEPSHFGAFSGLGLIYMRTDRPALAQIYLRRGVAANPWLNERSLLEIAPKGDDL